MRQWGNKETNILKKIYPFYLSKYVTRKEMEKIFNRSIISIQMKAFSLNISNKKFQKSKINERNEYNRVLKKIIL